MDLTKLKEPFPAKDIEWRVQTAGTKNDKIWAMVLAYVTNRAIMDRLDEVCGPAGWKNEFTKGPDGGILCGLSIFLDPNVGWVTKWDGAENTDIESVKGGLSNAMKRSAVQWGIGRYLYHLEATYIDTHPNGQYWQKGKQGKYESFKWNPPLLPAWALPKGEKASPKKVEKIPEDPFVEDDKILPDSEKKYYLDHPALSDVQKSYLISHNLTASLKYKIDEQIAGAVNGQKELV